MSTHTEDTKNWWLSKFTKGLPTIITSSKTGEPELHPQFIEALTTYASQVLEKERERMKTIITQVREKYGLDISDEIDSIYYDTGSDVADDIEEALTPNT